VTTVVVKREYVNKLVYSDLKRKWNKTTKEHGLEPEQFNPADFTIQIEGGE
tara:strand:+ start:362 stop:514 length:153 start_codon:yes stop_codon:yes gene_type:complete